MKQRAGFRIKKRHTPLAILQPSAHDEILSAWMKRQRLHQASPAVTFVRFGKLLAVPPTEALPKLPAVARGGIGRRTHPREIKFFVICGKVQRENPTRVVVALDDSPARKARCAEARDLFSTRQFPHAHFTHEVSR